MHYKHQLHPLVHLDIIDAYEWYESNKENLGEEFAALIQKKILEIVKHPHHYGSKLNENYREVLIQKFPYVIVYKINESQKEILIVSVHHAKKHPRLKYR